MQVTTSETRENKSLLSVSKPPTSSSLVTSTGSSSTLSVPPKLTSDRYLMPTPEIYPSKATMRRRTSSDTQSDTSASASARISGIANGYAGGKARLEEPKPKVEEKGHATALEATDEFDVQSVINERRPPKLKTTHGGAGASTATSIASDQYSALIRGEGYSHIYVTTEDRSDDVPSPCGNASESTGTGSLSVVASISAGGSISAAGSVTSGSGSRANGNGGGSGGGGVHIGEGGAIGSDVRIYVDDTDSASSSNGHRRAERLRDDQTLDASTTVSSTTTTMRDGCRGSGGGGASGGSGASGSGGIDERKETPERPPSAGRPLDPS